jgi:hypothetical protein
VSDSAKTEQVEHPAHYVNHASGLEAISVTEHMSFCAGNAFKYLVRRDQKHAEDPITDLKKAKWYVDREAARLGDVAAATAPIAFAEVRLNARLIADCEPRLVGCAMIEIAEVAFGGAGDLKRARTYIQREIDRVAKSQKRAAERASAPTLPDIGLADVAGAAQEDLPIPVPRSSAPELAFTMAGFPDHEAAQ